ncbi:MAG: alpha/beta hydrolase-fold protein [Acidimicrobiales bacterium]
MLQRFGSWVTTVALVGAVAAACGSDGGAAAPTEQATPATADTAAPFVGELAEGGTTERTFTAADGTEITYVLVVPPGVAPGPPTRVLVAFPPGGQELDLARRIVDERWHDEAVARGWVVVSPAAPATGLYYNDASAALVPELLDAVAAEYPPEGGRFDLAGVSNGGLSAFKVALAHPDRFRSLVTFPGNSPAGGADPDLARLEGLGVALFVGGDDAAWRAGSEETEATLRRLGIPVELTVVEGEGHVIESLTGAQLFDALERVRQ